MQDPKERGRSPSHSSYGRITLPLWVKESSGEKNVPRACPLPPLLDGGAAPATRRLRRAARVPPADAPDRARAPGGRAARAPRRRGRGPGALPGGGGAGE